MTFPRARFDRLEALLLAQTAPLIIEVEGGLTKGHLRATVRWGDAGSTTNKVLLKPSGQRDDDFRASAIGYAHANGAAAVVFSSFVSEPKPEPDPRALEKPP